jgi:hypothetical protein
MLAVLSLDILRLIINTLDMPTVYRLTRVSKDELRTTRQLLATLVGHDNLNSGILPRNVLFVGRDMPGVRQVHFTRRLGKSEALIYLSYVMPLHLDINLSTYTPLATQLVLSLPLRCCQSMRLSVSPQNLMALYAVKPRRIIMKNLEIITSSCIPLNLVMELIKLQTQHIQRLTLKGPVQCMSSLHRLLPFGLHSLTVHASHVDPYSYTVLRDIFELGLEELILTNFYPSVCIGCTECIGCSGCENVVVQMTTARSMPRSILLLPFSPAIASVAQRRGVRLLPTDTLNAHTP